MVQVIDSKQHKIGEETLLADLAADLPSTMRGDVVEGAEAIADFINKPKRIAFHLMENKMIPAFKLGGKWHLRKSTYLAFIARLESGKVA